MTATYATPLELARFMVIDGSLPDKTLVGEDRIKEEVGTGNNSTTRFFLDNAFVIADTYTLYYGATEVAATNTLTETTHYTLDKDNGEITLTGAGVTLLGTNKIYAAYSYVKISITNTLLQEALNRSQDEIDYRTGTHWSVGTDATPDYVQVTNEEHAGKGKYDRDYFLDRAPIPDVSTTLDGDIAIGVTTITVVSTAGFPSSGNLLIGSEKITYTGKTSTTFTGVTATTAAHSDGDAVYSQVVEISTTDSGTTPTWTVLTKDSDFDIDLFSGKVHLYKSDYDLNVYSFQNPPRMIPNRFRATYQYGHSTIPDDINRLCLMIAAKDLLHTAVRSAYVDGKNDFEPTMINIDEDWINSTIDEHTALMSNNT